MIHMLSSSIDEEHQKKMYGLGDGSYFSESAYELKNWTKWYWGEENAKRLLQIKRTYDPQFVFGCHQCVGWGEEP